MSSKLKNDQQFSLKISKGIDPYEYTTEYNKLNDLRLPSQEIFFLFVNGPHKLVIDST